MDNFCIIIITLLSAISGILYLLRTIKNRDISILGAVLSRLYLTIAASTYLVFVIRDFDMPFRLEVIHIGVILVIVSDILISLVQMFGKKYISEIQAKSLLEKIKTLQDKQDLALENSVVGFYVVSMGGKFELVNKRLGEILEYSQKELLGMYVYDLLPDKESIQKEKENLDRISSCDGTVEYIIDVITKSGKIKTLKIIGKRTYNGHQTITGNVLEIST